MADTLRRASVRHVVFGLDDVLQWGAVRNASTSAANSAWCWNRDPCAESG
jgi:hypothetical protein